MLNLGGGVIFAENFDILVLRSRVFFVGKHNLLFFSLGNSVGVARKGWDLNNCLLGMFVSNWI